MGIIIRRIMMRCRVDCEHEWFISGIVRCTRGETLLDTGEAEARLNGYAALKRENEQKPSIKMSDGDVWLVFPDAILSIEGICNFGAPGPIVKRNLRKWRDALLAEGKRMKLSEPNIRLVIDAQKELSMKLFAFSWMNGELCEPFQELGKMAEQLEAENAVLIKRLWDYEHQASDERIRDEK